MFIGPEGDFTLEETGLMAGLGGVPVNLGGLTLRAETAAIVATTLVMEAVEYEVWMSAGRPPRE